ncbi:MAG: hypothetical protein ACI4UH_03655 [Dorea sp.]
MTSIEKYYLDAFQNIGKENIDFFGINLTDANDTAPICKLYLSEKISKNRSHPLAEFVERRKMLRYFADVSDSENPDMTRIDLSLYQRNDSNMEALFAYLCKYVPFFGSRIEDVKKIAGMKITDVEGYHFASLYHVGLIEDENVRKLLKFHFFTRWCEDPNYHTKDGYRDQEYLAYLKDSGIEEYRILTEKATYLLEKCEGHLWMAGMDIFEKKTKYKIYLKNIKDAYEFLPYIVGIDAREHLQSIACWNDNHKECRLAGAAVALNTEKVSSVNLYFHLD